MCFEIQGKGKVKDVDEEDGRIERIEIETVKYTWTINNFSELNCKKLYSDAFLVDNHPWRIVMYPKGEGYKTKRLSMYMCVGDSHTLPVGCYTKPTAYSITILDQIGSMNYKRRTEYQYNCKKVPSIKHSFFMTLHQFHGCKKYNSYLVNDTCIVVAEVNVVHLPTYYKGMNMMMSSTTISELVDFRGLCKIEKRFVQLLEEACSNHPTLIENQQKRNRTQEFIEWSFTALGRVMHFVNTKSAEDMNDDACNELQNLWEELNAFGFDDLTWLERHVQSALSMKNHHMEVDIQVDKMELAKGGTESLFKSLAMCFKSINTSHTLLDPVLKLKENESDQEGRVEKYLGDSVRYIWTIKNFSKKWNCRKKLLSEPFFVHKSWQIILLCTKDVTDKNKMWLEICLRCSGHHSNDEIKYRIYILNQFDRRMKKETLGTEYQYVYDCFSSYSRHTNSKMELGKFYDPSNGFLVNDTCIVVAKVLRVAEPAFFKRRFENLLHLKCLCEGERENYFVRLFEQILDHYNRVGNFKRKKRSQEFKEWSLVALERVLYFLKTHSMKNMNHDACKELRILWEELKVFGFHEFASLELHL